MGSSQDLNHVARLRNECDASSQRCTELLKQLTEVEGELGRIEIKEACLSPVYTIPDDVLEIILEEACAHPLPSTPYNCARHLSPLMATHVCRRWRETAMALSTIWTCISLGQHIELLKMQLARSKSRPILIRRMRRVDEDHFIALFEQTSRWRSIDLGLLTVDLRLIEKLEASPINELPALEYVAIDSHNRNSKAYRLFTSRISCPNLKYLKLDWMSVRRWAEQSLARLQVLNLGNTHIYKTSLYDLCDAAPQLVEIVLRRVYAIDQLVDGPGPWIVTFPHLQTLRFFSVTNWNVILCAIDAPSLRTLECDDCIIPIQWTVATVYPSLSLLRLVRCPSEGQGRGPTDGHLFRHVPQLKDLELIECKCSSTVLSYLADQASNDGHLLLPALEVLTMIGSLNAPRLIQLHAIAQSRVLTVSPLRELQLRYEHLEIVGAAFGERLTERVKLVEYRSRRSIV